MIRRCTVFRSRRRWLILLSVGAFGLAWTVRAVEPKTANVEKDHAAKMAKGLAIFKKHVQGRS